MCDFKQNPAEVSLSLIAEGSGGQFHLRVVPIQGPGAGLPDS